PHVFRDFSARYDFAGRANQMNEEKKFLGREIERHAGTNRLVSSHINFQIIDAQMLCLSLGSAPQYRAHPGYQFRKRERLYQVIVRAQFEAFHPIAHTVAGGKKKNGRTNPAVPQFRDHLPTIFVWQHYIDNKKVELGRARALEASFTIARKIDGK